ncbi:autotransporter-associated beta strand repeat-containing protein, partial [Luteolibacter marinus]|uniref:autotransporter-associated beta strand repeat-containing protein n=1 Tax=Luteolibacter marinus TaxID=2776705 RepID=UPI0018669B9D
AGGHSNGFRSLTLSGDATIGGSGRWDIRPITAGQASLDLAGNTLTKLGFNTIAFVDGNLTNPGTINVEEGLLAFTRSVISGTGNVNVNNGSTLRLENYTSGTITKPIVLTDSTLWNTGANFTLDASVTVEGDSKISVGSGSTLTVPNPITGTGNLEKQETGNLASAGDNSFSGNLVLNGGNTILTGTNSYAGTTTINSGTLQLGTGGTTGSINGNEVVLGSTSAAIRFNRSDDFTFPNVISGSGITGNALNPAAVNKDGANTVTLTGASTYTGTTRLGGGTVAIGSDNSVFGDPTALIDLRTGAIRSSDASPRTIPNPISYSDSTVWGSPGTGNLTLTGDVAYGGGSKTITVNNAITEFSGIINGGGNGTFLTKAGPGTLILSGDNTYTQITAINSGVLQVGNGGTTGTLGSSNVVNNASLVINVSAEIPINNVISGTGTFTHAGPAFTIIGADNTYTGDTIVTDGTISPSLPYFADSSALRLSGDGTVDLFHGQTDVIDKFFIDDVPQAAGLWGRVGSIVDLGADFESALITGDGLLSVSSSGSAYDSWATDAGLTAGNDGPADNPDFDLFDNLGEFGLDGDPLSGATGGKIVVKVASVGGEQVLTLTIPVRTAVGTFNGADAITASGDGVTYTVEGGNGLDSWLLDIDEVTGPDAAAIQAGLPGLTNGDWVYRTFRTPGNVASDPAEFIRARVE